MSKTVYYLEKNSLSIGYKSYRSSWIAEEIRHIFQNKFAHGIARPQAWFRKLDGPNHMAYGTDAGSNYQNW